MTTTGTVIVTIACIVGYGALFGPPIVVIIRDLRKRMKVDDDTLAPTF